METGISLLNPDMFTGEDFTATFVTDGQNRNIRQKDSQEVNNTSNKQPITASRNMVPIMRQTDIIVRARV
jgi:hypothetical protein